VCAKNIQENGCGKSLLREEGVSSEQRAEFFSLPAAFCFLPALSAKILPDPRYLRNHHSQSGTRYSQPGIRYSQPGIRYSQPGTRYSQPGTRYSQPGTHDSDLGTRAPRLLLSFANPFKNIRENP